MAEINISLAAALSWHVEGAGEGLGAWGGLQEAQLSPPPRGISQLEFVHLFLGGDEHASVPLEGFVYTDSSRRSRGGVAQLSHLTPHPLREHVVPRYIESFYPFNAFYNDYPLRINYL